MQAYLFLLKAGPVSPTIANPAAIPATSTIRVAIDVIFLFLHLIAVRAKRRPCSQKAVTGQDIQTQSDRLNFVRAYMSLQSAALAEVALYSNVSYTVST